MFGEHESESPRVPSPWDLFLPSPPDGTPPRSSPPLHNGIPKLVPEVEEGNVEYKLKLTNISNARFARLVTQLKWRLLEGGGQAYYELGVADSGALIGLARSDLEESLETLEMMAGEIGASVIVVKEIEVPPTIAALADKESGLHDPDTGDWNRKMKHRAHPADEDYSTTATETETDLTTDLTDYDDIASSVSSGRTPGIATPTSVYARTTAIVHRPVRTNPERPTAQSSPFITPIDDDLALFSMEPEPAFRDDAPTSGTYGDDELELELGPPRHSSYAGLEISAVYKPRPVRHRIRPGASAALGATAGRHGKRYSKPKEKKVQPWHQHVANAKGAKATAEPQLSKEEKALQRRVARDKKREEKRAALIARATEGEAGVVGAIAEFPASVPLDTAGLARDLATMALAAEIGQEASTLASGASDLHAAVEVGRNTCGEASPVLEARQLVDGVRSTGAAGHAEPRLIVEALVVRKMSIEEATLDFSRFALI
ncbi:uncharacterized protein TRAVEDRAFT_60107 [Trametes versicolor FP-101664 SS1]|uniref:uncharacterized protein n=1 Tax=Trametes versicolor (strain FP-101664) TaxID=717944 RepID=UPI00046221DD|nr:uncharacterized protein TRAVEDRAFT_60107 [Trametes versicolor FP-101664 SS1]EIW56107.1 hypothetical protein TRAVEDRAFT_60107 [Trametes versicolor FP-101664 SS1]